MVQSAYRVPPLYGLVPILRPMVDFLSIWYKFEYALTFGTLTVEWVIVCYNLQYRLISLNCGYFDKSFHFLNVNARGVRFSYLERG